MTTDDAAWERQYKAPGPWRYFAVTERGVEEIPATELDQWVLANGDKYRWGRWRNGDYPSPFPVGLEKLF